MNLVFDITTEPYPPLPWCIGLSLLSFQTIAMVVWYVINRAKKYTWLRRADVSGMSLLALMILLVASCYYVMEVRRHEQLRNWRDGQGVDVLDGAITVTVEMDGERGLPEGVVFKIRGRRFEVEAGTWNARVPVSTIRDLSRRQRRVKVYCVEDRICAIATEAVP